MDSSSVCVCVSVWVCVWLESEQVGLELLIAGRQRSLLAERRFATTYK